METWTVSCGSCDHTWSLAGSWTVYETAAIESRPCPCCGSHTLQSPEPRPVNRLKRLPKLVRFTPQSAKRVG